MIVLILVMASMVHPQMYVLKTMNDCCDIQTLSKTTTKISGYIKYSHDLRVYICFLAIEHLVSACG